MPQPALADSAVHAAGRQLAASEAEAERVAAAAMPLASGPTVGWPLGRGVDLAGTNILLTGGTSGVGLEAAKVRACLL